MSDLKLQGRATFAMEIDVTLEGITASEFFSLPWYDQKVILAYVLRQNRTDVHMLEDFERFEVRTSEEVEVICD
mgnify:CR=1 FL=1